MICGAITGLFQTVVLKNHLDRTSHWFVATTAGTVIGALLGSFTDNAVQSTVVAYLVIGICQWFAIRRRSSRTGMWILVLGGWPLIIRPMVSLKYLFLASLLWLTFTGIVLVLLLSHNKRSADQVVESLA